MTEMPREELRSRLKQLGLFGLLARCDELSQKPWLDELLNIEEAERQRRSLDRRLRHAQIGAFKPIADFDWTWPRKVDRQGIEELFGLGVSMMAPTSSSSAPTASARA